MKCLLLPRQILGKSVCYLSQACTELVIWILKLGPVPRHVAFIMDGNRRFARKKAYSSVEMGHSKGYNSLESVLEVCLKLGLESVSVYAFSIENFNRPNREVASLMDLAQAKLLEFSKQNSLAAKYNVRIRVVGALEMLPERVQTAVDLAESVTMNNSGSILYICMPYTSRHEIARAVLNDNGRSIGENLLINDVSEPLDILIRTSGETRLSNFMLYQAVNQNCIIKFVQDLWPDFSPMAMMKIFFQWQYVYLTTRKV